MLDQQYFGSENYFSFIEQNFIPFHAVRGQKAGDELYEKFVIRATPTVLIINPDESEIDRIVGFGDTEEFNENMKEILKGTDTFASLLEQYNNNPDDILASFKLAKKYQDTYNRENAKLAVDIYKEIIEKENKAKNIGIPIEDTGEMVCIFEYAKYSLGAAMSSASDEGYRRKPEELLSFVKEFPESRLLKNAYRRMMIYFSNFAPEEERQEFYNEMVDKFPDDADMLYYYVNYCARQKTDIDKGLKFAEKMVTLKDKTNPYHMNAYAKLLALKDDGDKLENEYGKNYVIEKLRTYANDLRYYANFWLGQEENLESAKEMIELAIKMQPDRYYFKQTAASIYLKLDDEKNALKIYGPNYIKNIMDSDRELYYYARYWGGKEKNLKSALKAAKKAVELKAQPYYWQTLSIVNWKLKKYNDALSAIEEALKLSPENSRYKKQIEDIKKDMSNN